MGDVHRKRKFSCIRLSKIKKTKIGSIQEEELINYNSLPSLESIAIINVATGLCKQTDIRDKIRQHSLEFDPVGGDVSIRGRKYNDSLNQLEKNILNKLSLVPLPNSLKEKVADIIMPVVLQILDWIRYGRKDTEYMDSVCWTNKGTIDTMQTFQQLVNKDSAQHYIESFYKFACTHCLEDYIAILWNKLPKEIQIIYSRDMHEKYENHLILYWTKVVKNESLSEIKLHDSKNIYRCNTNSIYQNMFTLAISEGNISAVKYFWNKLTVEEINRNLAQWINDSLRIRKRYWKNYGLEYQRANKYSDVLYFLLSQMDDAEQQREMFHRNSEIILISLFLDWQWQRFLLPTIQKIWFSLDEEIYVKLLFRIVYKRKEIKTTEKLLKQLWHDSPIHLKKCFIQYIIINPHHGSDVVCDLLVAVGGVETIKLILNYATVEEKKKIVFSVVENDKLYEVIYNGKLSLYDNLLSETVSLNSDIQDLKANIVSKFGNRLCCNWIYNDNWKMVEEFFSWAFTSQDQIDNFKNNVDKIEVVQKILKNLGNYELVDKFLNWCFSTKQEINQFKKDFAESDYEIVMIGVQCWGAFEKFIRWCFTSEDVKNFKYNMLQSYHLLYIIYDIIVYHYNFEFADKLIGLCCDSNEEIKQYKTKFVLSDQWLGILRRFVSNFEVYHSEYNNLELTRKLIKLFFPLEEEVLIKLKQRITATVDFDDYYVDDKRRFHPIKEELLFNLMDAENYNREEDDDNKSNVISSVQELPMI